MPSPDQLRLYYHSLRHTPPAQLLARLRLIARRRYRQRFGPPKAFGAALPARAPAPPQPIFPPRKHLVVRENLEAHINLLNQRFPWRPEVDWHPPVSAEWTHLRRFHFHYMEYCEAFSDEEFRAAVDSWVVANPPYQPDYWYDAWSSYVISLRSVVWMQQLAARPGLADDFAVRAGESICLQMRTLADHLELDIRGNHLVKNVKALLWAGSFFTGEEALAWQARGKQLLAEILDQQILPDGMHYELSASYHAQVFADLLECAEVLPEGNLRRRLVETFPRLAHALACMTHPDGGPALFNDSGLTMAYPPAQVLDVASRHIGNTPAPEGAFCLPDAGYYGFRSNGDYVLVKAGKIGPDALPAHAHADLLSFEWDVGGQRIVVDPGVSEYQEGKDRTYARSTEAHNTVTIDGRNQAEMWGAFRVGRRTSARIIQSGLLAGVFSVEAEVEFCGSSGARIVHRRHLRLTPKSTLYVSDHISSESSGRAVSSLLFHPDCRVVAGTRNWGISWAGQFLRVGGATSEGKAAWMPDMGVSLSAQRLLGSLTDGRHIWELSLDAPTGVDESK